MSARAWGHRGLRAGLVLLTCVVAWAVPNFSLFADLIGSFMMTIVGFVIPPVLFLGTFGWVKGKGGAAWYHWILCSFCIVVGLIVMVTGTINAVKNIITYYEDGGD